ncbi:hypothetical protein TUM4433_05470 [Shewanella schlegeliana]|nr:hypothetical protein TUM4433_05470 [Shewanella schlegeliana]
MPNWHTLSILIIEYSLAIKIINNNAQRLTTRPSLTACLGNSVTTLKDVQTTDVPTLELEKRMPMDAINLNLKVINEVKNNGRLLSDVAKDYGLSTKTVYQIVHESEQRTSKGSLPILKQTKQLSLRIKQLLSRR